MAAWPQYVCAILEDAEGRLLLESRPDDARLAAGKVTCFGGQRESAEAPEVCLRRELREELSWEPENLERRVALWVSGELVAWFYHARLTVPVEQLRITPGFRALLVAPSALSELPMSTWHAAVIHAWRAGQKTVELEI